jgi:hypothetical protein
VARRAIDLARSRALRREVDGAGMLEGVAAGATGDGRAVAPDAEVLAALAALPEDQRTVVVLRHLLELTPSEIAEVVGVPRGTVNSRLRRGLDTLAGRLVPVLVVALAVAAALTTPGRATAEWVRHHLSEVTGQLRAAPPPPAPASRYGALPGGGRMLAVNGQGLFAFGLGGAPRELLGRVDAAAWSPHGRFAVAVRGIELIAVSTRGRRHWSLAADRAISAPAWSPSGYRVAFVVGGPGAGRTIHVVAGDGTGEHVLAATRAVAPAWQPGVAPAERLATVDSAARVVLRDADSGRVLWRARTPAAPTALAFKGNRRLLVLQRDRLTILDGATGARVGHTRIAPTKTTNITLAVRPRHAGTAIVRRAAGGGDAIVLSDTTIFTAPQRIAAIAWSPHGDWLAAELTGIDGWTLLHLRGTRVDRIRTLAAGRAAHLAGWCCG